ncbi:MAG: hypothetical protein R3F15_09115 [Lysobacterales bacterium]
MKKRTSGARGWNATLILCYLLLAGSLLANFVIFGAVPSLPEAGPALAKAIARQTWDLNFYMSVGARLNAATGMTALGVDFLQSAMGPGLAAMKGNVSGALLHLTEHTYSSRHALLQWLRWAPPALLVVAILLTAFRPRQVRSFNTL